MELIRIALPTPAAAFVLDELRATHLRRADRSEAEVALH